MKCTRFFSILTIGFALAACSPVTANRGNLLDEERLAQIKVSETEQTQVQALLGPPTMIGTFDKNNWYYSGKRTERIAFLDPDVTEQRTVAIHFDDNGRVDKIAEVSPDQQIAVAPENRITPTTGRAMNVIDQLMENAGRPGLPGSANRRQPGTVVGPGGR
jgi:outer membrane protein assembly factor BamE (lipoprotein component of BamABCDE complex)